MLTQQRQILAEPESCIATFFKRSLTQTPYEEIFYAEVFDKLCLLHTYKGEIKTYCALGELESRLNDKRFLRCHRSYLINLQNTRKMCADGFIMHNGHVVPISRSKKKWAKDRFYSYQLLRSQL